MNPKSSVVVKLQRGRGKYGRTPGIFKFPTEAPRNNIDSEDEAIKVK
jgi:hypothetical protein